MHDANTAATAEQKNSDSPSAVSSTAPSKPLPNGSRAMRFQSRFSTWTPKTNRAEA